MLTGSPDTIRERAPRIASGLRTLALLGLLGAVAGCSTLGGGAGETGKASYYGARHHGLKTASGERFDQHALTAAHRSLPFGTRVRVTNLNNDRSVVVRINDRGPHTRTHHRRLAPGGRATGHAAERHRAGPRAITRLTEHLS